MQMVFKSAGISLLEILNTIVALHINTEPSSIPMESHAVAKGIFILGKALDDNYVSDTRSH